jgi:hypothetical protein
MKKVIRVVSADNFAAFRNTGRSFERWPGGFAIFPGARLGAGRTDNAAQGFVFRASKGSTVLYHFIITAGC